MIFHSYLLKNLKLPQNIPLSSTIHTHTHSNLLKLCNLSNTLFQTNQVHAFSLIHGFLPHSISLCASLILQYATFGNLGFDRDVFVGNTLLTFYGNCGFFVDAIKVFDEMPEKDKVSWNIVIGLCSLNGFYNKALCFLREMVAEVPGFKPDLVTIVSVLPICAETEDELMARSMFPEEKVVAGGKKKKMMDGSGMTHVRKKKSWRMKGYNW